MNIEKGLSPRATRQLCLACITSIADYGSLVWWRGQASPRGPLQALQNLALRKILGVFRTALIEPIEVEAAPFPPRVRLDYSLKRYVFRALKLLRNHSIYIAFYSSYFLDQDLGSQESSLTRESSTSKGT